MKDVGRWLPWIFVDASSLGGYTTLSPLSKTGRQTRRKTFIYSMTYTPVQQFYQGMAIIVIGTPDGPPKPRIPLSLRTIFGSD